MSRDTHPYSELEDTTLHEIKLTEEAEIAYTHHNHNHDSHNHNHNQTHMTNPTLIKRVYPQITFVHFIFHLLISLILFIIIGIVFSYKADILNAYSEAQTTIFRVDTILDKFDKIYTEVDSMTTDITSLKKTFNDTIAKMTTFAYQAGAEMLYANSQFSLLKASQTQMTTQLQAIMNLITNLNSTIYYYRINSSMT